MRNSTGGLQARIAAHRDWIDSDATRDFNDVRGTGRIEERLEYRPPIHWGALVFVAAFWLAVGAAVLVAVKVLL